MKIYYRVIWMLTALTAVSMLPKESIYPNVLRLKLLAHWLDFDLTNTISSEEIADGIPDGWEPLWWGGATHILRLEKENVFGGANAARILHTNTIGAVALSQDIAVVPGMRVGSGVYSRGEGGAIQVWFSGDQTEAWIKNGLGGWRPIPPSSEWQLYQLELRAPPNVTKMKLLLRADGDTLFDEAYSGNIDGEHLGPNLLTNPGFEADGVHEDPIVWWLRLTTNTLPIPSERNVDLNRISYINIMDMTRGQYDLIMNRSSGYGRRCALVPEMTSWLIALDKNLEEDDNSAARESIYKLAIRLAPDCPQPYAALAQLYESHKSYSMGAEFYNKAALNSVGTILEGKYRFAEGLIYIRFTGELNKAISAFKEAEKISGWEDGKWYLGAASFYLGKALEADGRIEEAILAYQRVLACGRCATHHEISHQRIVSLSNMEN